MALSDLWTAAQLETAIRRELMDPTGGFSWSWTSQELQYYINDWQTILQDRFEFVWGSATTLLPANTNTDGGGGLTGPYEFPITSIATNMLRPGNMWYATTNTAGTTTSSYFRLVGRTKEELEVIQRDWREVGQGSPEVAYMADINTIGLWPPPSINGTLVNEYPLVILFTNTTSATMQVPAWTRYSFLDYACWRAWERPGPNQNLTKSSRRKKRLEVKLKRYRTIWENYLPDKAPSLRIGHTYEGDILNVGRHNTLFQTWV
jgi:hypothetical protein